MTDKNFDTIVQEKIEADSSFQASLADLSDDEKSAKIEEKRSAVRDAEFKSLSEAREKAEQIAKDQRQRAEKAEGKPAPDPDLSTKDIMFLTKADIHEEDIEEVTELAKLKKIPVADAYKYLKPVLDVRNEERKTALAVITRPGGRSGGKEPSGQELLDNANAGKVPDDDAGIEALADARMAQRTKK